MTELERTTSENPFKFLETGPLAEEELSLELVERLTEDPYHGLVPCYKFDMVHREKRTKMGNISLRIGNSDLLVRNSGQIGYDVLFGYRGNRYAARSCRLLLPLAHMHGLNPLWITCDPDNIASRKSCVIAGAKYVDTIRHRTSDSTNLSGFFEKCRYRIDLHLLLSCKQTSS
ncbi:MAG: hypothetical protein DF168_01442 [Candidatus Moanabacter tarae]|uniref:N-acetyltransferase domain-containing protein n=1 Tax=Candidatus Moanibacter tarae TaxID=2200854 RepID=A0A2Z4ADC0_9BACT|nr:MAG: hypothetical protein DF168_01442 [Candidatus Moanabacter tarae]